MYVNALISQAGVDDINPNREYLWTALLYEAYPAYILDVQRACGRVYWLRKALSLTITAGSRTPVDPLPTDFYQMQQVRYSSADGQVDFANLPCVDNDPDVIAAAGITTLAGHANGYYVQYTSGRHYLYITAPAVSVVTLTCIYTPTIPTGNDPGAIQLDDYIPAAYQWPLVERLKMAVYENRVDISDPRYTMARTSYAEWIQRLAGNKTAGTGSPPRFVR